MTATASDNLNYDQFPHQLRFAGCWSGIVDQFPNEDKAVVWLAEVFRVAIAAMCRLDYEVRFPARLPTQIVMLLVNRLHNQGYYTSLTQGRHSITVLRLAVSAEHFFTIPNQEP